MVLLLVRDEVGSFDIVPMCSNHVNLEGPIYKKLPEKGAQLTWQPLHFEKNDFIHSKPSGDPETAGETSLCPLAL